MNDTVVEYIKGQIIFNEGDPSDDLFIVKDGVVKLYKQTENGIIPLAIVGPGSFLGEQSFWDKRPRSATAEAAVSSRIIKLDAQKLQKEIDRFPSWLVTIVKGISERIRTSDEILVKNNVKDETLLELFKKYEQ